MKNELKRHKKSDRIKWGLTAAAFVLVAVLLVGLCLQVFGHGKAKPSEWFKGIFDFEQSTMLTEKSVTYSVKRSGTPPQSTGGLYDETFEDGKLSFFVQYAPTTVRLYAVKGIKTDFYDVTGGQRYITLHFYDRQTYTFDIYVESNLLWLFPDDGTYTCVFTTHGDDVLRPTSGNLFTVERNRPTVPLPEPPVKEGHTFDGWYYDEALTQPYDGAPIYADTKLYAKMTINRYTVQFNGQNGEDYAPATVEWNTSPTLPTPTRTGYTFVGWFDGDTKYEGTPIRTNTVLTARWEIMTFTVTFMVDGETYDTLVVDYGTALVDVVEQANAQNLQVLSVRAQSGQTIQNTVTDNLEVQTQIMAGVDKVKNGIKQNWKTIAIAAGGAVALILVISLLTGLTKKPRKARR